MQQLLLVFATLGFFVSAYALRIQTRKQRRREVCDFSLTVSCTTVLLDPHGFFFGIPNSLAGMFYYGLVFMLAAVEQFVPLFYFSLIGLLFSASLAYISWWKLRTVCLVCTSVYLINLILFLLSLSIW